MIETIETQKHRSVSQYNQYTRCPYAFKLARIDKVWSRPAAWLAQGSAVHEAAEWWERTGRAGTLEDMTTVYTESYEKHIGEACEITPNFDWWFASGPYGGEQDTERRYLIGMEQLGRYVEWYEKHPEEVIWISPDGTPGIELGFDIDLDGVLVRGYLDAVIETEKGLIVRDNKTGNHPGDDFQLGVYGVALAEQFGIDPPQLGDYWMGKSGKPTYPFNIGEWTRERVSERFRELEDNIKAERFEPLPEPSKCQFCDVSYSCKFSAAS
jgi:putative RecB family exonuclease